MLEALRIVILRRKDVQGDWRAMRRAGLPAVVRVRDGVHIAAAILDRNVCETRALRVGIDEKCTHWMSWLGWRFAVEQYLPAGMMSLKQQIHQKPYRHSWGSGGMK